MDHRLRTLARYALLSALKCLITTICSLPNAMGVLYNLDNSAAQQSARPIQQIILWKLEVFKMDNTFNCSRILGNLLLVSMLFC